MAHATKHVGTEREEQLVMVEVEKRTYTLELSEAEARAVRTLCGSVFGTPVGTWRGLTDSVWSALNEVVPGKTYKVKLPGLKSIHATGPMKIEE